MKFFVIILMMTISSLLANEKQKMKGCSTRKGLTCLTPKKAEASKCEGLSYYCPGKSICCKQFKNRKLSNRKGKKKSCVNTRACKKRKGSCIDQRNTTCSGKVKKRLCSGKYCICCIRESKCNKTSSNCKKRGGFCFDKRKSECIGKVISRLCKGKHCACCKKKQIIRECQCGEANTVRVIGGDVVSPQNKYPWAVTIFMILGRELMFCGGSIIKDRYVITSAQCLQPLGTWVNAEQLGVGVADPSPNSNTDDIPNVTRFSYVEKVIPHEKFNSTTKDNNIAVIKLKEPLDLTANKEIKPICLPKDDNKTYENEQGIIVGWGMTDPGIPPALDDPKEATLSILSPDCPGNFSNGFVTTDNMLCAGLKDGGKSACHGDGGGPLFVTEGSKHILVGLFINGSELCKTAQRPNVFTRVTKYISWIKENTSDGMKCKFELN